MLQPNNSHTNADNWNHVLAVNEFTVLQKTSEN